jgi:FkbM family methyltransferase
MKKTIINLVRCFGFDIVPYQKQRIGSRKTDRLSLHETKTGNYYLPTDAIEDEIALTVKNDQIFDADILKIAQQYIKPNTCVVDIGSNFGQMAVLMSKCVGERGVVHAFEADDFVFSILQKNAKENANNIVVHHGAVHDKSGETLYFPEQDFKRFGSYGSYGIDYVNGKGRPVKTIAIDDVSFELPVSFMKIDIQGGDLLAMKGAVKTIEKYKMPIIFEYEYSFEDELNLNFQEYVDFIKSINYKFSKVVMGQNYLILPN